MKNLKYVICLSVVMSFVGCAKKGCTDPKASNFDFNAKEDNSTCIYANEDAEDPLLVYCNDIYENNSVTLKNQSGKPVDYVFTKSFTVYGTLTIEEGVRIQCYSGVNITVMGSLVVHGTSSNPVIIEGYNGAKWRGILCSNSSYYSSFILLNYTTIKDAGYNTSAAIHVNYGITVLKNCAIENSYSCGIINKSNSLDDLIENTHFKNCASHPIVVNRYSYKAIKENNTFTNNGVQRILYEDNTTNTSYITFLNYGIPIELAGQVQFTSLSLRAGVQLYVQNGGSIRTTEFNSYGTSTQPVVIRGVNPVRGSWGNLQIGDNSGTNYISYLKVQHAGVPAGSNYVSAGIVTVGSASFQFSNCEFLDIIGCALKRMGTSTINQSNCTFTNCDSPQC